MDKRNDKTQNDIQAQKGMERMSRLHSLEAEGIVEKADAWEMNEALQDPEESLPRPRSDLPKNRRHESIHQP